LYKPFLARLSGSRTSGFSKTLHLSSCLFRTEHYSLETFLAVRNNSVVVAAVAAEVEERRFMKRNQEA
jgi:hypothetical protein